MPRHKTISKLSASLAFIIMTILACPASADIAISLQNGLCFVLPASWHIRGGMGGALFYAQNDLEKPGLRMSIIDLPGINLSQEQISRLSTLQLNDIKQSLDKLKGGERLLKSELLKEKINQHLFLKYSCEFLREDGPRAGLLLCFYNNRQSFMISFEYRTEKNYLPLIEEIISSFAIEIEDEAAG